MAEEEAQTIKKIMVINRKAPHGSVYALEGLEMVLIAAMFDQDVHLVFADDGVQQLRRGQDPAALGMKDFSKTFRALDGYGVEKLFAERESLAERGLAAEQLVVPVELIDRAELARLMDGMDVVLSA